MYIKSLFYNRYAQHYNDSVKPTVGSLSKSIILIWLNLHVWRVVLWYYYTSILKWHYSVLYNLVPQNYSFMLCSLSSSQLFHLMPVEYLNLWSRDVMHSDLWSGMWCGTTGVPSITDKNEAQFTWFTYW